MRSVRKKALHPEHQNPHRRGPGSPHSKKPDLMPKRFQCESAKLHPESTVLFRFRENSLNPPASSSLSGAPSSRKANHKPPNTKTHTAEGQVHPTARSLISCRRDFNANQPRFIPKVPCFPISGKHSRPAGQLPCFRAPSSRKANHKNSTPKPKPPRTRFTPQQEA
jgi:hypothetical protein